MRKSKPKPKLEVTITAHADEQVRSRLSKPLVMTDFSPTQRFRDGLRLWVDREGAGLLVDEKQGTGWAQLTVVTVLTAAMVKSKRFEHRQGGRMPPRPRRETPVHHAADRWLTLSLVERVAMVDKVDAKLREREGGDTPGQLAFALGLPASSVEAALVELEEQQRACHDDQGRWYPRLPTPGQSWRPAYLGISGQPGRSTGA